jgi:uncharacterized SAM-binding protein YcdF (DUF218 family)
MNRRLTIFKSMILFLAILAVWIFLAPTFAERLIVARPLDHADVILVLAGSSAYLERTRVAAHLYRNEIAQKVLLTNDGEQAGWSNKEQGNPPYVELAKQELVAQGVPVDAIEILSPNVSGTIMEAKLLGKKASEGRWKSLLIVTSNYHTRRALWTFENVFSESSIQTQIGIVPAITGEQNRLVFFWWLTPKGWRDVGGEYVKSLFYHIAY